ncbi:pentapeptide repeat-containing protein [Amycolatopsis azurea]|uniref:pentapeptide repeat-containing protein n=1 Tax=Amycolatopsis azurea TaxID=36819 RepID=UPI003821527F
MIDDARPGAANLSSRASVVPVSVRPLPRLTQTAMWVTAAVITVVTAGAVIVLWWPGTAGLNGPDLVKARLDALKIGLSIGVGSGGVAALYLAWRRQHSTEADLDNRERVLVHQQDVAAATQAHQERVAEDSRSDAIERRITELYLKAAELLGSDKAPVRLSGLYALERLAQNNETQRQTIANVLCAYLRMPYDLPIDSDRDDAATCDIYRARTQEREVRRTAQRLLLDHLKPERTGSYWGPLTLNLAGAQLIEFALIETRIGRCNFLGATFVGKAWFRGTTFTDDAGFDETTFTGDAGFHDVTFTGRAWFGKTTFTGVAKFDKTSFDGKAWFHEVTFDGDAVFCGATFADGASFDEATCRSSVLFDDATVQGKPLRPEEFVPGRR